jgi:hypothetical protein
MRESFRELSRAVTMQLKSHAKLAKAATRDEINSFFEEQSDAISDVCGLC